jgi:SAM-dependent methyltransferase
VRPNRPLNIVTLAAPTLEGFDEALNLVASDPRIAPDSPVWIGENLQAAGDKVKILDYILTTAGTNSPRILDVGAQIGALTLYAARLGCRAAAVDDPFYATRYGKIAEEHGVDYRECDLGSQRLPFEDALFDFVVYTDVIEHHSFSPKRVLDEIYRVLSPGGKVIVTTPNHASIYNCLLLLSGKSVNDNFDSFFDAASGLPTYLGHHREYTGAELRLALERTGFRVQECRIVDEDLSSLLYYFRLHSMTRPDMLRRRRAIVVRALGKVWQALHLPFGRVIWAVGQKPAL